MDEQDGSSAASGAAPGAGAADLGAALEVGPGCDVGALLRAVTRTIGETLDFWSVDLWCLSRDADSAVCRAFWCCDDAEAASRDCVGTVIGLDQSHDLRRLVLAAQTIERHAGDDLAAADAAALEQGGYASRIDVPLRAGAQVLGVLSLAETRGARRLTALEHGQLRALCRLAAVVLHATGMYEAESERGRRLVELLGAGRGMTGAFEIRAAAAAARREAAGMVAGVPCALEVILRQDDGSYSRVASGDDDVEEDALGWRADALARQAVDLQRPEQARVRDGRARLLMPLIHAGEALGYLELTAELGRRFRAGEVEYASLLADQTATAVSGARAYRALASRSATDTLTGLFSRWYFYERVYAEVARARRYRQPLSLIIAELDTYDTLAESSSAEVRDATLAAIAKVLMGSLRDKVDIPCRLGGGRFAILLPNTPGGEAGAIVVAERVRHMVAETRPRHDDLGALGRHAMSLGVACFPGDTDDADELVARAEVMLAVAVAGGGDRVEPPLPEPEDEAAAPDQAEAGADASAADDA